MAFKQSELHYWDGAKWVLAITHSGSNALVETRFVEMMGNPIKLSATLTNFAKDWTSTVEADQKGYLTDIFRDYQQILLREGETHQILFSGRIYKIEKSYNPQLGGSTIRLEAFDALAELRDFSSSGLKESKYRHFKMSSLGSNTKRSDVIQELIKDSIGATTSGWITNANSNINVTDYTGYNERFNTSATDVSTDDYIEPARTGHTSILDEISRLAAADPHTSANGDKDMGYNYYVDHNITIPKPASGNWTTNPPAHLNYYKRGTRPTAAPGTDGLLVKFGTGAANQSATPQNTSNQTYLNNQKAQKIMLANYEFDKPSHELFSHAIVTYDSQDEKNDKEQNLVTQFMEIVYVSEIANFQNSSNVMFFKDRDLFNHDNKPASFKNPPALLQYKNASNAWTDTGAYVHMATAATSNAVTGSSTVRDYEALLVGYSDEYTDVWESHVAAMQAIGSDVELRLQLWNGTTFANPTGSNPVQGFTTNPTCTFNGSTTEIGKGRAKTAYGVNRPKRVTIANVTGTETLRNTIMGSLYRMNMDLRRGKFTVTGPPYYMIDMKVKTSSSNNLTFKNITTNTNEPTLDLTRFNIRDGFTLMNFGTDQTFSDGNEVAHGQVSNIVSASQITTSWNTGTAPSVDHYVRAYIPLRAGDFIRVQNAQESTLGNFFITHVDYSEMGGSVMTTFSIVGRNEDVAMTSGGNIPPDALNVQIAKYTADNGFGWNSNTIPYGQRSFELRGVTFVRTDRDTISWTVASDGGFIKVGGRWYSIVAGNTGNLSTTIPGGETTCPEYYIYWDPDVSYTALQVSIVGDGSGGNDYTPDGDNVIVAVARANANSSRNAEFWQYGRTPGSIFELDFYKDDPNAFIADNAMTAALQRKGTQPFTSNVVFENTGGTGTHVAGHHSLNIKGKNAAGSESTSIARVINFADDKTATLASTTSISLSAGENTGTGSVIWYIYFDLSGGSESGGNYTGVPITATTDYSLVNTDNRGLLAIAAVSTDYTQQVAFQTFGSKIGNINADNIAANSITANAIQANSIGTGELSFTPNTDSTSAIQAGTTKANVGLSNVDNNSTATIRAVAAATSGTLAGIQVDASKLFIGTGTYNHTNTGFYVDSSGNFSLKNKLAWNGTTLSIDGTVEIGSTAASVIETRANGANQDSTSAIRSGTTASDVGLGSVTNQSASTTINTALQGNHTGNLNSLDINNTSGSRLQFTSSGIHAYNGSTLKATFSATGAAFTCYGAGGTQTNAALLMTNGSYVSYISAGSSDSDTRYDAAKHYFYNFGGSSSPNFGYIEGLRSIRMNQATGSNNRISSRDDIIMNTEFSADHFEVLIGSTRKLRISQSDIILYQDMIPNQDSAFDIGTNTVRFENGYFDNVTGADLILDNTTAGEANDIDGTRGHWRIQEGETDLFIRNEVTGKKYKFTLEEV